MNRVREKQERRKDVSWERAWKGQGAKDCRWGHNLGLTCDPVKGLVQIPCIERNAVAAMRAISSVNLSRFLFSTRKISFDEVVATMYRTGKDMDEKYRETSHGGLAQIYFAK